MSYSALPQYAPAFRTGDGLSVQAVFQLRQRPGSYGIGQETVGAGAGRLDPLIGNEQLEYYTREGAGIFLHGLLLRVLSK